MSMNYVEILTLSTKLMSLDNNVASELEYCNYENQIRLLQLLLFDNSK